MRIVTATLVLCGFFAGLHADEDSPTAVRITGEMMTVNGQKTVPVGLFGVHAVKLTPEIVETYGIECYRGIHFTPGSGSLAIRDGQARPMWKDLPIVIDCQGDRYCTATVLKNRNYEQLFRRMGRQYARKCKEAGHDGYVEFWNEPYLNWASRSHGAGRNHYNPKWYDVSKAEPGWKVTIKGWDKPLEYLRWKKLWARGEDGKIYYGVEIPEGAKPGDTFRSHSPRSWYWADRSEQTFTVVEQWGVYDPTQVGFWSGKQNLQFYLWMFRPFARAVKETHPDVKVLAGWDFGFSTGDWAVFEQLCAPVIDEGIEWIDGVTDHHYGTDTRAVPAWYEVATAYAMTRHGKWIRGYNTECGGKLDPAVHGEVEHKGLPEATYALRDILGLACQCPAKVGSRTAHHAGPGGGAAGALRFLRDLRGRLVRTEAGDADLWPVASVNGDKLVVALFNNAREPRRVDLSITPPNGTKLGDGTLSWIGAENPVAVPAGGGSARLRRKLAPLQAVKLVFPLSGHPPARAQIRRRQFFAEEGVLHELEPGEKLTLHVNVDRDVLAGAQAAKLRLVLDRLDGGKPADWLGSASLNGTEVKVPARRWTVDVPVKVSDLRRENTLALTGGPKGARVCAASLLVDAK